MSKESFPLLTALAGRGPAAYTGEPFSFLLVEVRGGDLCITGSTPLRSDGERYIQSGTEYSYTIPSEDAEKLLTSLTHYFHGRPERILADTFEFARPHCPLKEYLDSLQLAYQYQATKGEPL